MMHPVETIIRLALIAMIALYGMNFVADIERMALRATRAERLLK